MNRTLCGVVYGGAKVGKSWLLDTMPAPRLILDAEGSLEFTESKKIVWDPMSGPPPPASDEWDTCIVHAISWEIIDRTYQWLLKGEHEFVSLGFDHLTEIQKRIITHYNGTSALREADWGTLLRTMEDWTRKHRDLRYHPTTPVQTIIFNCAAQKRDDVTQPMLQGAYRDSLPYMVDFIGYLFVTHDAETGKAHRRMLIEPDEKFVAGQRVAPLADHFGRMIELHDKQGNPEGATISTMLEVIQ